MSIRIVILLILFLSAFTQAQVYKIVNEDGSVSYTDSPPEGVEREEVDLPPLYTEPAIDLPEYSEDEAEFEVVELQPQQMTILTPLDETTIPPGQLSVPIDIGLSQPLREDQVMQVLYDGQLRVAGPGSQFVLGDLERGAHTIQARIIGAAGDVQALSNVVTIYVHRATVR